MSATLAHLVRKKRDHGTYLEKVRYLHKLARELAEVSFTAGRAEEGRSWLEIADYARRKESDEPR